MNKLKNEFKCIPYCYFDKDETITISLLPNIEFDRNNYKSLYTYELYIYWLCFGIIFKYTSYKNN